jgi:hypothetical protein
MFKYLEITVAAQLLMMSPQHVRRLGKARKLEVVPAFGKATSVVSRASVERITGPLTDDQIRFAKKVDQYAISRP